MNPKQIGIGILVLAIIAVAVMQFNKSDTNTETATDTNVVVTESVPAATSESNPATSDMVSSDESTMDASEYEDGTYEATGNYTSPAQEEEVNIVITLADGVVVDAEFVGKATHETSKKMQGLFSEGFTEEVVGKSIDEINLTVVNGSSLTPKGFMDALEKVKTEASA